MKLVQDLEEKIVSLLEKSNSPLTLSEIAVQLEVPEKKVYKSLRKLFEKSMINCVSRKYAISKK